VALSDAIDTLKTTLASVTGISRVGGLIDIAHNTPYLAVYLGRADWTLSPATGGNEAQCLGEFHVDLYAMGFEQGFARAEAKVASFYESIPAAILGAVTLGGYVDHITTTAPLAYDGMVQLQSGSNVYLGARWRIPFKYHKTLT